MFCLDPVRLPKLIAAAKVALDARISQNGWDAVMPPEEAQAMANAWAALGKLTKELHLLQAARYTSPKF